LLRNLTTSNNSWLKFTLRGVTSNRNGIGARLVVTAGGREYVQQLLAGFAMVSGGGDLTFHFGLGNNSAASRVEVLWPSGQIDVLTNVAANQALTIQEGEYGDGRDTEPPVISEVQVGSINGDSATITWNTNELADSQVEYGLTTAYGSLGSLDTLRVTNHSAGLSGLAANSTYHYRVKSKDAAGNLAVSADNTFKTGVTSGVGAPFETSTGLTPVTFALESYPNPFRGHAQVRVALPEAAQVQAMIYDITGREIGQLFHGHMAAGYRLMRWGGASAAGRPVSSGVYFIRVTFQTPAGKREVLARPLRLMR
jgi:hypothetical protein